MIKPEKQYHESCIFINGPLHRTIGRIACFGPNSPVNKKIVNVDGDYHLYEARYHDEEGWERDEDRNHVLYYRRKLKEDSI